MRKALQARSSDAKEFYTLSNWDLPSASVYSQPKPASRGHYSFQHIIDPINTAKPNFSLTRKVSIYTLRRSRATFRSHPDAAPEAAMPSETRLTTPISLTTRPT